MSMNLHRPLLIACFTLLSSASAVCQRHTPVIFDTPAQRLDQALQDFAHKTGCPVTVKAELLRNKQASAVLGIQRPAQALDTMLRHAELQFTADRDGYTVTPYRP